MAMLTPDVIARESLMALENNLVTANLVNRQFDAEYRKVGDTITVRKPTTFVSDDFNGSAISIQNIDETGVPVVLNHLLDVSFKVTAKELSLDIVDFSEQLIQPALRAHAQKIDELLLAEVATIPYFAGTAGSPPATVAELTALRKVLNDNKVPFGDRSLILDTAAADKMLQLEAFYSAEKVGDAGSALREGSLGKKFGFSLYEDQNVKSFAPAGAGTVLVNNGAGYVAGTESIVVDGVTTAIAVGKLVTIGGFQHIVTSASALSTGNQTLGIYPGLRASVADNAAVTLVTSHVGNVGFHRNAFCLASAALEPPMGNAQSEYVNFRGLGLRVVMDYDISAKSNIISIDGLFGVKTLNRDLAARLLG